jgi:hypothetical protein
MSTEHERHLGGYEWPEPFRRDLVRITNEARALHDDVERLEAERASGKSEISRRDLQKAHRDLGKSLDELRVLHARAKQLEPVWIQEWEAARDAIAEASRSETQEIRTAIDEAKRGHEAHLSATTDAELRERITDLRRGCSNPESLA